MRIKANITFESTGHMAVRIFWLCGHKMMGHDILFWWIKWKWWRHSQLKYKAIFCPQTTVIDAKDL